MRGDNGRLVACVGVELHVAALAQFNNPFQGGLDVRSKRASSFASSE